MTATDDAPSTSATAGDPSAMFVRVMASPSVFYKHEQRGDPELTAADKARLLNTVFVDNPRLFLQRHHEHLTVDDLPLFTTLQDDSAECCRQLIRDRCKTSSRGANDVRIRNRRYRRMQQMLDDTSDEYFADWEMRQRAPLLYDHMIGQYLTKQELTRRFNAGTHARTTITGMFVDFADAAVTADKLAVERMDAMGIGGGDERHEAVTDDARMKEGSSSESELDDAMDGTSAKSYMGALQPKEVEPVSISATEQRSHRDEYVALMKERFLDGKDTDYTDYSLIDNDDRLDDVLVMARDAEDRWFDDLSD